MKKPRCFAESAPRLSLYTVNQVKIKAKSTGNTRKANPQKSKWQKILLWYLGTAGRLLAAAQGIPVLEPVVECSSSIDVDCRSYSHNE
jgi:hypothetical protein